MRIGIITAMAEETLPILEKFGNVVDENIISDVKIRKIEIDNNVVYLATSGIGEIKAAMTTQLLKDLFDIDVILNFGFVGALDPVLNIGELVIAEKVCHYQFDISKINGTLVGQYSDKEDIYMYLDNILLANVLQGLGTPIKKVTVASGDKFVGDKEDKEKLRNQFKCDICEMELAGITIVCEKNSLPLLSLKVVSDKADESAHEDFNVVVERGVAKYSEVLPTIISVLEGTIKTLPPIKK